VTPSVLTSAWEPGWQAWDQRAAAEQPRLPGFFRDNSRGTRRVQRRKHKRGADDDELLFIGTYSVTTTREARGRGHAAGDCEGHARLTVLAVLAGTPQPAVCVLGRVPGGRPRLRNVSSPRLPCCERQSERESLHRCHARHSCDACIVACPSSLLVHALLRVTHALVRSSPDSKGVKQSLQSLRTSPRSDAITAESGTARAPSSMMLPRCVFGGCCQQVGEQACIAVRGQKPR